MATINLQDESTWTLIASTTSPTFAVISGIVEIIGTTGSAPSTDANGVPYPAGKGEKASADILAEFEGGTATALYARAANSPSAIAVFT